jgi:vitamin B12 transporter
MRKKISLILAAMSVATSLFAQDSLQTKTLSEVVITGTRYELPAEKSGKTITKISSETLEQHPARSIGDVLNTVPNLQLDGIYGTPGTNIGYYARGAKNRQTVILVDGVPMVDPTGISPEYDLRLLSLDQVKDIEVMRGGLSSLYGSGAAASVINISLKAPTTGTHGSIDLNGGSFGSFGQNLSLSSSAGKFYVQLMANNTKSKGFSSAQDDGTGSFDKDGYDRQNGMLRLGFKPTEKVDVQLIGGLDQFSADYDDGPYVDAPNKQNSEQWRAGVKGTVQHAKGELQATVQQTWLDKDFKSTYNTTAYTGLTTYAEVFDRYSLLDKLTLLGGVSIQSLSYDQEQLVHGDTTNFSIVDPYVSVVLDLPVGLNIQAGVRLNNHSEYGSKFIYNFNPSYLLTFSETMKVKILGSISTSYITPSLYQLFAEYGNASLKPEETTNLEGGATVYAGRITFSVVYFDRNETNPIGFESLFDNDGNWIGGRYYTMADERDVNGVEIEASGSISSHFSISATYSYATSDNEVSFYRIPKTKYGVNLNANTGKGGSISLRYQFTGERKDMDYSTFEEVTLNSFALFDVSLSQTFLKEKLMAYFSANNLFDKDFVWAPGFTSMGRNFTGGVKYRF